MEVYRQVEVEAHRQVEVEVEYMFYDWSQQANLLHIVYMYHQLTLLINYCIRHINKLPNIMSCTVSSLLEPNNLDSFDMYHLLEEFIC